MAWSGSYICADTIADILNDTVSSASFNLTQTHYIALFNNSITPAVAGNNIYANAAIWNSTSNGNNEVWNAAGGNWPQGGVTIGTPTLAANGSSPPQGVIYSTATASISESSVTLTAFFGGLIYNHTGSSGTTTYGNAAIYFGGSYTVTSGTIGITWQVVQSVSCPWYINLT